MATRLRSEGFSFDHIFPRFQKKYFSSGSLTLIAPAEANTIYLGTTEVIKCRNILRYGFFYFLAVATCNWGKVRGETRGGAAPNDLTWHKKNCGGREERGGSDILLSFLMSFTAIRLASRMGRGEKRRR